MAPRHRHRLLEALIGIALGVAWSPCWGAVLGTVHTIIRSGSFAGIGMLLMATYAAGAALMLGFVASVVRDAAWKNAPDRRQRVLALCAIMLCALAGAGFAFGVARPIAAWLIPYAPFVFFSL